jgi:glutamyl-tRNA synthetase
VQPFLAPRAVQLEPQRGQLACALFKDRCSTLLELADWLALLAHGGQPSEQDRASHVTAAIAPALAQLAQALEACQWSRPAIAAAIKQVLTDTGLKMPQLAMPVRVLLLGTPQTPSLDAVIELMERPLVLERLKKLGLL